MAEHPNGNQGGRHPLRRILRAVLLDAVALAVALAAGEMAVRTFYPQAGRHVFSETLTGGHPIWLNSFGLRDVEFPRARPAGQRRVLCLGDSTTFGAGLAAEETYPKQMERLLNPEGGSNRWFVINAGGQGSSITGLTEFLKEKGLAFGPEAVVLGFSPTMVSVAGQSQSSPAPKATPGRRLERAALSLHARLVGSTLYALFDANLRRRLYRMGIIRDRMDHPQGALLAYAFNVPGIQRQEVEQAYRTLEGELSDLKRLLDERGIPLIVLGIPSRFRISESPPDNERGYDLSLIRIEPGERVAGLCGRMKIPFVDLRHILRNLRKRMLQGKLPWDDLYIPTDYAHLNATGMKETAKELQMQLQRSH